MSTAAKIVATAVVAGKALAFAPGAVAAPAAGDWRFSAEAIAPQNRVSSDAPLGRDPLRGVKPPRAVADALSHTARRYASRAEVASAGLSPAEFETLFVAMIRQESAFNPRAVSPKGAMGLGQIMPATARELGLEDPFDIADNLDASARYLTSQLRAFGDPKLALAAYNAGPGAVRRHKGVPPYRETRTYVTRILAALGREPRGLVLRAS